MASHAARMVTAYRTALMSVAKSDTVNLRNAGDTADQTAQALIISTAGNMRYIDASGFNSGSAVAVPAGLFPVQIRRIYSTDLTADGIVCFDKDPG